MSVGRATKMSRQDTELFTYLPGGCRELVERENLNRSASSSRRGSLNASSAASSLRSRKSAASSAGGGVDVETGGNVVSLLRGRGSDRDSDRGDGVSAVGELSRTASSASSCRSNCSGGSGDGGGGVRRDTAANGSTDAGDGANGMAALRWSTESYNVGRLVDAYGVAGRLPVIATVRRGYYGADGLELDDGQVYTSPTSCFFTYADFPMVAFQYSLLFDVLETL